MVRRILLFVLLVLLLPAAVEAQRVQFVIVTRTGAQIPAAGPPRFVKNMVLFRSARGTALAMNVVNLDLEETERINGVDLPVDIRHVQQAVQEEPAPLTGTVAGGPTATSPTITNSDLRQLRAGRALFTDAAAEMPVGGIEEQAVERAAGTTPALNETEWRTRSKTILNRQRELERRARILSDEAQRYERGMVGLDASKTQKLGADLDRVKQELGGIQQELQTLQRRYGQLRDEARRAGVPPEWIQ